MAFNLAKYMADYPENSLQQIMEAFLNHAKEARQAAGITVIVRNGHRTYEHPVPLNHPFVKLWRDQLGKTISTEVNKRTLPNHVYTGLIVRSSSTNPWDLVMTVVVAINAGSQPEIDDLKCINLIARLKQYMKENDSAVAVVMEECEADATPVTVPRSHCHQS